MFSIRRLHISAVVSFVLLIALFVCLFYLPLRPTAWGGPRGSGPFEDTQPTAAGRFARDARLHLESLAKSVSPNQPLEATAEVLMGYYAMLSAVRFAILWLVLRRLGAGVLIATIGVFAAALPDLIGAPRQNETEVGLLLFVVLLGATTSPRIPWWVAVGGLPVLFVVWANAHASVTIGIAWLGVLLVGRAIEWRQAWKRSAADRPAVGRLVVAAVLCILAACVNPDGPRLFVDAFKAARNPSVGSLTAWQPVDFGKPSGMPWFYFGTLAALLIAQIMSSRVLSPTALCIVLTFGIWPLVQQRGQAYWWLIVPCLLVPMMRGGRIPIQPGNRGRVEVLLPLLALVIAFLASPTVQWLITKSPRDRSEFFANDTPWHVARELTARAGHEGRYLHGLREAAGETYPNGQYRGAILCGEAQGDFLAWVLEGMGDAPVMLYTRPETMDRDHWSEARQCLEGRGDWWEIAGRHQVNLIVIDPNQRRKLADQLYQSSAWRIVQDDELLVAVRRTPKLPVDLQGP